MHSARRSNAHHVLNMYLDVSLKISAYWFAYNHNVVQFRFTVTKSTYSSNTRGKASYLKKILLCHPGWSVFEYDKAIMNVLRLTILMASIALFAQALPRQHKSNPHQKKVSSLFHDSHKKCEDSPQMQKLMHPPSGNSKRYVIAESVTNTIDFFAKRNIREVEAVLEDCDREPEREGLKKANCHHDHGAGFYVPGDWSQARQWENDYKTWYSKKMDNGKPYMILQKKDKWVACTRKDLQLYHMMILGSNIENEHYHCSHDWQPCV